jgi:hypothetical protein
MNSSLKTSVPCEDPPLGRTPAGVLGSTKPASGAASAGGVDSSVMAGSPAATAAVNVTRVRTQTSLYE